MYSYEDRIRAVELYIKLGKRVKATIRQLGYPTKNALKGWFRQYERGLDLPKGYARPKPKYSQEQKEVAVRHYLEHGRCIAATIRAQGYPGRASLVAWIEELHPQSRMRVVGKAERAPRPPALKQAAVIALCTRQGSAEVLAQEIGVCRPTLYNWKNQLLSREFAASMNRPNESLPPGPEREELERQLEVLRRDIRRLQIEQDLLKKAIEIIKKDLGIDRQLLTNREKTLLVDALRHTYTLAELLAEVALPRSSCFYHRARLDVADRYVEVRRTITETDPRVVTMGEDIHRLKGGINGATRGLKTCFRTESWERPSARTHSSAWRVEWRWTHAICASTIRY